MSAAGAPGAHGAPGRARTLLGTLAVLGALGWSALAGARQTARALDLPADDWRAALTLGERARIERWLTANEARYGFRPGYALELLRTLERDVPHDGIVSAVGSFREPAAGVFPMLQALSYPRLFLALPALPAGWPRSRADYDPRQFVLAFGTERPRELPAAFERVSEGVDWELWRCREGPP